MKTTTTITSALRQACLLAVMMLVSVGIVRADITNPTATTTDGFMVGGTTNVVAQTMFSTSTMEGVTEIRFSVSSPQSGVTLSHGMPSPAPYNNMCGSNTGDETAVTGSISWSGQSTNQGVLCGAFMAGTPIPLGLSITTAATVTQAIIINVEFIGDNFGENGPANLTNASTQLVIQPQGCFLTCPADITVVAPAGSCEAQVNIPLPTVAGTCVPGPQDRSGVYPVGVHEIVFVANSSNMEATCSMTVTVQDSQDPVLVGCDNVTENLDAGACEKFVPVPFSVSDNCESLPASLSHNGESNAIVDGVGCTVGGSSFYRLFDLGAMGINTEFTAENVEIGIYESFNNAEVTVNLYRYNGSFADMELVSSNAQVLAEDNSYFVTVPIHGVFSPDETIAVEITTQASMVVGFTLGVNDDGQTAPTYISSEVCGQSTPTDMAAFFGTYGALITLEGKQSAYYVDQTSGPDMAEALPAGIHNMAFEVTDASGNSTSCNFTVELVAFESPISSLACNDDVNVSLDSSCEAEVTADMVLEGDQYGCYDNYTVELETQNGVAIDGNMIRAEHLGMTLIARVIDPNGNSCWGRVHVEDKYAPVFECDPIYTTCSGGLRPEDAIPSMVTFAGQTGVTIDENIPSVTTVEVPVNGMTDATITDVNVVLDIDHTYVGDLFFSVIAPDGTEVLLTAGLIGDECSESNLRITFDDEAMSTHNDLLNAEACTENDPTISGAFQSQQALSAFDGIAADGVWRILINDQYEDDGGVVNAANLVFTQSGATIGFPTSEDVTFTKLEENIYSVSGLDKCGPVEMGYTDEVVDQGCDSPYSQIINRTWGGTDAAGNDAVKCVQQIFVFRNDLSTLSFPPNYDGFQEATLSCSGNFATDENGHPALSVTGQPTGDFCDNVQVFPYEDTRIDICPNSYKLIRKFKLLEWCNSNVIEHTQIIKVEDKQAPIVEKVDDITVSVGAEDCETDFLQINYPNANDSGCTAVEDIEFSLTWALAPNNDAPNGDDAVYTADGVSTNAGGFNLSGLPAGIIWARLDAADKCGNVRTQYFRIYTEDQVPPFAICDEFTVVGIGGDGFAVVEAMVFDDGSHDNCGDIVEYRVRKMGGSNSCPDNQWGPDVTFCCAEVGQDIMVAFEVTDRAGLRNTCMVNVSVEDKLPPYITDVPADITLDCHADVDTSVTGYIKFVDNCRVVRDDFVDFVEWENQCGEKRIRRTFTVEDAQGFKDSEVQYIYLEADGNDLFTMRPQYWPADVDQTGCLEDIDPSNLPGPIINEGTCSLVSAYSEDQVFNFAGSCMKILRKWTVIDWCQYNENNPQLGQGWWEHTQVIKLNNFTAPEFLPGTCNDRTECIYGENCNGQVTLTANATDDCTDGASLVYSYEIDFGDDGSVNASGNGNTTTRTYSPGINRIYWTVEDGCGNVSKCDYRFTVVDCKKPTPYCITSLTTVVMPSSGTITINAEDYNFGSFDNCTAQEDLRYSFSSNINNTTMTFTCADIPNGESANLTRWVYVHDQAGNYDFCTIELVLQEGAEDHCEESNGMLNFAGQLTTEENVAVEDVMVVFQTDAPEASAQMMTGNDGAYSFSNVPMGFTYEITAEKDGDYTNGVSTLDLVMIQRHVLGFQTFDSPYKVIASDIDNNEKVSASDIVALRKLVLGIRPDMPNGQKSWRFVNADHQFADNNDPWPFVEEFSYSNINAHQVDKNFVAVKVGDVNSSATYNVNAENTSETRSNVALEMATDAKALTAGTQVSIPVYADNFDQMLGYQFTIQFDAETLDYAGYEAGALDIKDYNFSLADADQGMIATSWNETEAVSVDADEALFYLVFNVVSNANVSEVIDFSSRSILAEAYGADYTVYPVNLSVRNAEKALGGLVVEQNRPNPFSTETSITFSIDRESPVSITVMDVSGKVIFQNSTTYTAGKHTINLDQSEINTTGVLYYQIDADQGSVTKKMIKIN